MHDMDVKEEEKETMCDLISTFHMSAIESAEEFTNILKRPYYITPKTLLDYDMLFIKLYEEKKNEIVNQQQTLKKGSIKIKETNIMVAQLKIDLTEAQPELEKQNKLTEETLVKLKASSAIAEEKTEFAEKEAEQIQNKKEQVQYIVDKANARLAESMPRIEKSEQDVRNIEKKNLVDLRMMKKPPESIEYIFKTVCIVLGEKFEEWKITAVKLLMNLDQFINRLIDKLDAIKTQGSRVVPEATMKLLQRNTNAEHFSKDKLETSLIGAPLANWCIAILDFALLKQSVEPMERNAAELNAKLEVATREFDKINRELQECKSHFDTLKAEFDDSQEKKDKLDQTIKDTEVKLGRAEK